MPWMRPALDTPFGFRPYDKVLRVTPYEKDAAAVAIYPGDVVILETDGGIGVALTGSINILGVAAEYSAASTRKADFLVYDHPDQRFVVQDDNDTTAMTRASEGNNVNIVTTTGDTTTFQSLQEIDSSTAATTATLAIKVHKLHPLENDSYASSAVANGQRKWIVTINNHFLSAYQQLGI